MRVPSLHGPDGNDVNLLPSLLCGDMWPTDGGRARRPIVNKLYSGPVPATESAADVASQALGKPVSVRRADPPLVLTRAVGGFSNAGHTDGMNGSEKIAVSLPDGLAERARMAVRQGRAASVSAYVASALAEKLKVDELSTLLDEMLAESGGPLTPAERRAADRALGVQVNPGRRRKPAPSKQG